MTLVVVVMMVVCNENNKRRIADHQVREQKMRENGKQDDSGLTSSIKSANIWDPPRFAELQRFPKNIASAESLSSAFSPGGSDCLEWHRSASLGRWQQMPSSNFRAVRLATTRSDRAEFDQRL